MQLKVHDSLQLLVSIQRILNRSWQIVIRSFCRGINGIQIFLKTSIDAETLCKY